MLSVTGRRAPTLPEAEDEPHEIQEVCLRFRENAAKIVNLSAICGTRHL